MRDLLARFTEKGSPDFDKFLEIVGERIELKNWDKYRGGLDVKGTVLISVSMLGRGRKYRRRYYFFLFVYRRRKDHRRYY